MSIFFRRGVVMLAVLLAAALTLAGCGDPDATDAGTPNSDAPKAGGTYTYPCLLYTSPSPRDRQKSRMPSSA